MSAAHTEPPGPSSTQPIRVRARHGPRPAEPTGGVTRADHAGGPARSRQNSCKDGLTGKGIVLPPDAAAAVDRREQAFAREFLPRDAVERELVRQMAPGVLEGRSARHADHPA